MRLEYSEESEDKLSKKTWRFSLTENCIIVLDNYYEMSRPSKRTKNYKTIKSYNRVMPRECNLQLKDIIMTYNVAVNIIDQINAKFKFSSDWYGKDTIEFF